LNAIVDVAAGSNTIALFFMEANAEAIPHAISETI